MYGVFVKYLDRLLFNSNMNELKLIITCDYCVHKNEFFKNGVVVFKVIPHICIAHPNCA